MSEKVVQYLQKWGSPPFDLNPAYFAFLLVSLLAAFFLVKLVRAYLFRHPKRVFFVSGGLLVLSVGAGLWLIGKSPQSNLWFNGFYQYYILFALAFCALLQTFRKLVGSVTLLALGAAVLMGFLFLRAFTAFTGETEIARLQVVQIDEVQDTPTMRLKVTPLKTAALSEEKIFTIKGSRFGALVYQTIFEDWFVLAGAKTAYSWLGLVGMNQKLDQTDKQLFEDWFRSEKLFNYMEKNTSSFPGVKSVQLSAVFKLAKKEGEHFLLSVQNDGGLILKEWEGQVGESAGPEE